ncbi:MAG: hypothetical protein LBQ60_01925 [Bacteroidales bacterium]|nr:hypothetical protein [Bacteroidales bacterium]
MLFDFASAKYVGIVCASADETSIKYLKEFMHFLAQKGIKYFVLGYFDGKKIPDNFLFWKEMEFITQNDLNLLMIPKGETVDKFIREPFDMLINCSINSYFPVEYISRLSVAKCKVGVLRDEDQEYDLMIDIKKHNTIDYFLENVKLYLSDLRNPG